jgi:predicted nucleotidyltransferase
MLTRNAVIEIVKNYAREIEMQGVHLRSVILYGSFANETQHQWSDIDVALVSDKFTGLPDDHDLFPYVSIKKPYSRIEVKTYSTDYFQKGDPFIEEIKNTGIEIRGLLKTSKSRLATEPKAEFT